MAEELKFGKGIGVAAGFDLGAQKPLDSRDTVATIEERDAHVTGNRAYEGMLVFVEADKKTYQYVNETWVEFGFNADKLEAEIVNDLTTGGDKKILSAEQGKVLKELIDAEAERADAAEKLNAAAAKQAQDEVDELELVVAEKADKTDLEALEKLVGELPEGTSAKDVVDYVNIKTAGIATDAALEELQNQLNGAQNAIDAIEEDYLKAADKEELNNAVEAEKERAMGVEGGLETRLAAVEDDYLKGQDKTDLEALITAEETRAKAAEKVNADAIAAIKEDVDAFFLDADMTENAKDTLKEIQTYMNTDVEGAAAMAESIEGVKGRVKAIEDDYLVEADKTELANAINGKVAQGDHDALAGRVATVEGAVATKAEQSDLNEVSGKVTVLEEKVDVEKVSTAISSAIAAQDFSGFTTDAEHEELVSKVTVNEGKIAALEEKFGDGEGNVEDMIATAKQEAIDVAALDATTKADAAKDAAIAKANELDAAMDLRVDALEEASSTHALQSDLDLLAGRVTAEEGKVSTLQEEMSTAKTNITNIQTTIGLHSEQLSAKAEQTDLDAVEEQVAEVEALANTNKTGLETVVGRVDAHDGLLAGLRADVDLKAAQADLEALDGRVEVVEGKLKDVADGAQVNVIETVKVNGVALEVADKAVDIAVPTGALAEKDKVAEADLEEALATKLNAKAEASVLEEVKAVADTAVQTVTVAENGGLIATRAENSNDVVIAIDDTLTWVFDCGDAEVSA